MLIKVNVVKAFMTPNTFVLKRSKILCATKNKDVDMDDFFIDPFLKREGEASIVAIQSRREYPLPHHDIRNL